MKSLLLKCISFCTILVLLFIGLTYSSNDNQYPADEIRNDYSVEYMTYYNENNHKSIGDFVEIVNVTDTVSAGKQFTLTICGKANTLYDIAVYFKSSKSVAAGLEPRYSNAHGIVTWEFRVSPSTTKGDFRVVITADNSYDEYIFTVV